MLAPGVYVGLDEKTYHADPALGSTGIKKLIKDPALFWYESSLNPSRPEDNDTPAKKLGRAYHKLILEPEKFVDAFKIKPNVNSTSIDGMLGEGEYKQLQQMRSALVKNPKQLALLTGGIPEVSIFWEHIYNDVTIRCKVRFDMFAPHWVADLKTTSDISDKSLRYAFGDFGYDISGAMYSMGAKALKTMIADGYILPPEFDDEFLSSFISHTDQIFAFVFQEKSAPYLTRCWCMTPEITSTGIDKINHGLNIYLENKGYRGEWPSKYSEIEDVTLDMLSPSIQYY